MTALVSGGYLSRRILIALVFLIIRAVKASPEETASSSNEDANATPLNAKKSLKFDVDNTDWGSYYDPKGEFCGKYDCYKILGFDFEEFGSNHPDRKEITQRYRSLSRAWHPDKSKHKNARERFVVSCCDTILGESMQN